MNGRGSIPVWGIIVDLRQYSLDRFMACHVMSNAAQCVIEKPDHIAHEYFALHCKYKQRIEAESAMVSLT